MAAVGQDADERTLHPVSTGELERRWAGARAKMHELEVDALVAQSVNAQSGCGYFRWLTDAANATANPMTAVFPREGLMTLVHQGAWGKENTFDGRTSPNRGVGRRVYTPSYPSVHYTGAYDAELAAREILKEGYRAVGIVGPATMYYSFGAKLAGLLKGVKLVDATDAMDRLKAVKSPEEIAMVRATCAMQDEVMRRLAEFVRPGMKEFEVYAYAQYQGQLLGSEGGIFLGSSATPPEPAKYRFRSEMGREIRKGDAYILLLETSGPGGYYAELTRPFFFGKAPGYLKDLLELVKDAQENTVKRLRPGASLPDIWHAHNAYMESRGRQGEERLHSHGQGYDLVERPLVRHDETGMTVEAGMYFACHPTVAGPREFMTISENFLVRADGTQERLHQFPQQYIEV